MEVKEIFDDHIDFLKGQEIVKVLYMNNRLWLFEKD